MNLELKKYALEKALENSSADSLPEEIIKKANVFIEYLQVSDHTLQHEDTRCKD